MDTLGRAGSTRKPPFLSSAADGQVKCDSLRTVVPEAQGPARMGDSAKLVK